MSAAPSISGVSRRLEQQTYVGRHRNSVSYASPPPSLLSSSIGTANDHPAPPKPPLLSSDAPLILTTRNKDYHDTASD